MNTNDDVLWIASAMVLCFAGLDMLELFTFNTCIAVMFTFVLIWAIRHVDD